MDKFKAQVRKMWEEAPLQTAALGVLAANVAVKILHEVVEAQKARTHSREVDRRRMKF